MLNIDAELTLRQLGILNTLNFMRCNALFDEKGEATTREPFLSINMRAAIGKFCTMCIHPSCISFCECPFRNHYTATQNRHPDSDFIIRTNYLDPFSLFEKKLAESYDLDEDYELNCFEEEEVQSEAETSLGSFIDDRELPL